MYISLQPDSDGYLAIILPKLHENKAQQESLLSKEEYMKSQQCAKPKELSSSLDEQLNLASSACQGENLAAGDCLQEQSNICVPASLVETIDEGLNT